MAARLSGQNRPPVGGKECIKSRGRIGPLLFIRGRVLKRTLLLGFVSSPAGFGELVAAGSGFKAAGDAGQLALDLIDGQAVDQRGDCL